MKTIIARNKQKGHITAAHNMKTQRQKDFKSYPTKISGRAADARKASASIYPLNFCKAMDNKVCNSILACLTDTFENSATLPARPLT
jgi:hypothetical protein